MILKGQKINLRPIKESDFDSFFKWHSDSEIRFQTIMHPYPVTEKMEKEWFEKAVNDISNKRIIFVVEEFSSKKPIGYFQLTDINFLNRHAMLGIVIGEKEWQGKGLGKEILKIGLDYGFNKLGLQKISLDVIFDNKNAEKLYLNHGFIQEGVFRNHFFYNGLYHSIKRMALFSDYPPK